MTGGGVFPGSRAAAGRDPARDQATGLVPRGFLGAVWLTLAGSLVTLVAATANSVVVSRALGPEGRGVYVLATTAVGLLWPLAGAGLQHSNTYWASRAPRQVAVLFWQSLLYVAAAGGLLTLLYAVWPSWLRALLGAGAPAALPLVVLGVTAAVMLTEDVLGLLAGLRRFRAYNLVRVAAALALAPLNLAALLLFGAGTVGVIVLWGLVNAGAAVLATALLLRLAPLPPRLDPRQVARSLSVGSRGLAGAAFGMLLLRADLFVVGRWAGVSAAAFYATAVLLADLTLRLPEVAGKVLFPTVAHADRATGDALTAAVVRWNVALTLLSGLALALAGRPLITLAFGGDFAPAYPALVWLLPGMAALAPAIAVSSHLAGRGYPWVTAAGPALALLTSLIVDVVTIPRWGAAGASIGSSVGYTVWAALLLGDFSRRSRIGWRLLVPSRADVIILRDAISRPA